MGGVCTRPALFDNADVASLYLTNPDTIDYPRAAAAFEKIGSHEYAVLCWLAAGRPAIAERVYERGGLTIIDNRYGDTPIWRMIVFVRGEDAEKLAECKELYLVARNNLPWLSRIVAAI